MSRLLGLIAWVLLTQAGPAFGQGGTKLDLYWQKLRADIARVESSFDGVMGVAVKDLTDGRSYVLNADEPMPTASMIKIAVLAELFRQNRLDDRYVVDRKDGLPGDDILTRLTPGVTTLTLRDVAVLMVAVSDNSATNVLIDRLGMANVNRLLDTLGLKATRLNRRMLDLEAARAGRENVATPREMVSLLEAIWEGRAFPKARLAGFLEILGMHKEGYLNRRLPEGAAIANKPGWLDGVRTDAALGLLPKRPYAVAVMTAYGPTDRSPEDAIAAIGKLVNDFFDRVGRSSDLGRLMP
jgi:beta-lactamase class A